MDDNGDIRRMNDQDFLAERARVREAIESLKARMAELDNEFDHRASAAWTEAAK